MVLVITISLALDVIPNPNISDLVIDNSKGKTPPCSTFNVTGHGTKSIVDYLFQEISVYQWSEY